LEKSLGIFTGTYEELNPERKKMSRRVFKIVHKQDPDPDEVTEFGLYEDGQGVVLFGRQPQLSANDALPVAIPLLRVNVTNGMIETIRDSTLALTQLGLAVEKISDYPGESIVMISRVGQKV
jgi:hypothetical protein